MAVLDSQPSLAALHELSTKVPHFPISAQQMVELAIRERAGKPVIDFYRAFPEDELFSSKDELLTRSEQINILNNEDGPAENLG